MQSSSKATGPDKKHKTNHHPSTFFTTLNGDSSSSEIEKIHEVGVCSSTENISIYSTTAPVLNMTASLEEDGTSLDSSNTPVPTGTLLPSVSSSMATPTASEFNKMVGYQQGYLNITNQFVPVPPQPGLLMPNSPATISDKLWAWNPLHEAGKDFTNFK